ncbi:hypothetical protein JCM10207_004716 [Rhodosporidiobolus poonsookiae]
MSTQTVVYSTKLTLSSRYDSYRGGQIACGSTNLKVPDLSADLAFAFEVSTRQCTLRWAQGTGQIVVDGQISVNNLGVKMRVENRLISPNSTFEINSAYSGSASLPQVDVNLRVTRFDFEQEKGVFARTACSLVNNREPADVAFDFPRTGQQLWGNEALLSAASPYFKQLFSSSFSEGTGTAAVPQAVPHEFTFEESDDETDQIGIRWKMKKEGLKDGAPFKTVAVQDSAATAYRAVLVWLACRHIAFAPLLSTSRLDGFSRASAIPWRRAAVSKSAAGDPLLPAPASPKSVYRLAHLLELPDLCKLALENLASQLTPNNAAYELYSDVATCYPEVRDVVLAFVVEKWDEVKKAKATAVMRDKARAGELDAPAIETAMLLAEKLADRVKAT